MQRTYQAQSTMSPVNGLLKFAMRGVCTCTSTLNNVLLVFWKPKYSVVQYLLMEKWVVWNRQFSLCVYVCVCFRVWLRCHIWIYTWVDRHAGHLVHVATHSCRRDRRHWREQECRQSQAEPVGDAMNYCKPSDIQTYTDQPVTSCEPVDRAFWSIHAQQINCYQKIGITP